MSDEAQMMLATTTSGGLAVVKYGGLFAASAATIISLASVVTTCHADEGMTFLERYGVTGLLMLITLVLWIRMEKKESEAVAYRDTREKADREQMKALIETLAKMTATLDKLSEKVDIAAKKDS